MTTMSPSRPTMSSFVRDIVGASDGDIVVMKAGGAEEGEAFFDVLSKRVTDFQVKQ